jgi:hypothetical protein
MSPEIPPPARAEICKVLEWFDAHPGGLWDDMAELKLVYDRWWGLIRGDPPLVDSGNMLTVPRLSAHGRLFLLGGERGTVPKADPCRLAVTEGCLKLDGQVVRLPDITSERLPAVLAFIADLIAHPSARRSGPEIETAAAARKVSTGRVDLLFRLLPSSVKSLIESNTRGYILAADAWRGQT